MHQTVPAESASFEPLDCIVVLASANYGGGNALALAGDANDRPVSACDNTSQSTTVEHWLAFVILSPCSAFAIAFHDDDDDDDDERFVFNRFQVCLLCLSIAFVLLFGKSVKYFFTESGIQRAALGYALCL